MVVMMHLAQGFARNAHPVGQIVVANGKGELARLQLPVASKTICSLHCEITIEAADPLHAVVLANVELVMSRNLAIVFERLIPRRFGVGAGEGNAADFQQLGSGEERHVCGIVKDRVANAALVNQRHAKASLFCLDGGGQPGRPCSHHQEIEDSILPRTFCCIAHASRLGHATSLAADLGCAGGRMVERKSSSKCWSFVRLVTWMEELYERWRRLHEGDCRGFSRSRCRYGYWRCGLRLRMHGTSEPVDEMIRRPRT